MKLCLILGGRGFIGSHLTIRLTEMGYRVRIFDRHSVKLDNINGYRDSVEIHEGDLTNGVDLEKALEGVDYVFHFISTTLPKNSNENPIYDIESNVIGTLKLLDFIKLKKNNKIKLIYISSGGTIYGIPLNLPISEDHQTNPLCSYGIGKLMIEKYLYLYKYLYGIDYAVLRVSNPFGERQDPKGIQGVVSVFMYNILKGNKITIWGDGSVIRDYIYIEDVIDAFVSVMELKTNQRIFNIGMGVGITLNDMIKRMSSVSGKSPLVEYLPSRQLDVPINYLDISLARSELHWTPKTALDVGLGKTWAWLKAKYQ